MTENIISVITHWSSLVAANVGVLIAVSIISFIIGAALLPVFVTRIPADYFCHQNRQRLSAHSQHPLLRLLIMGVKNILGLLLVLAGLVMLVTPGQGVITLLVGLMIMNYPGKYKLERWLIRRPKVLPAVNWLRVKFNHPPLVIDDSQEMSGI